MSDSDTRVLLVGNCSHLNRGCQAIDFGTRAILEKAFDGPSLVSAPYDAHGVDWGDDAVRVIPPPPDSPRWGPGWVTERIATRSPAESATRYFARRFRYLSGEARDASCVLSLGGDTHTLDYGRPDRFWGIDRAALSGGAPLVIWGATVGPFSADPAYERFCASEIGRVRAVFARDDLTVEYLRGLAPGLDVRRVSDPAFAMDAVAPNTPIGQDVEGSVGLNLSPLIGMLANEAPEAWHARAVALADEVARRSGRRLMLVGHVFLPHNDDRAFLERVRAALEQRGRDVGVLPAELCAPELKWAISRMHSLIGARTHATIAALSSGVPTLSIAYSVKARGINRDVLGSEEWVLDGAALGPQELGDAWERLDTRHDEVVATLRASVPRARERAYAAGAELRTILDEGGGPR